MWLLFNPSSPPLSHLLSSFTFLESFKVFYPYSYPTTFMLFLLYYLPLFSFVLVSVLLCSFYFFLLLPTISFYAFLLKFFPLFSVLESLPHTLLLHRVPQSFPIFQSSLTSSVSSPTHPPPPTRSRFSFQPSRLQRCRADPGSSVQAGAPHRAIAALAARTWRGSAGQTLAREGRSPGLPRSRWASRARTTAPRSLLPRPPPAARLMSRALQECSRVISHPAGSRRSRPNHI